MIGDKSMPDKFGIIDLTGLYIGSQISSIKLKIGCVLYAMNQLPIAPMITAYHNISIVSLMAYPKPATRRALKLYSKPLKLGFK